jgi:hypothetical protein
VSYRGPTDDKAVGPTAALPAAYVAALKALEASAEDLEDMLRRSARPEEVRVAVERLDTQQVRFRGMYLPVVSRSLLSPEQNQQAVEALERSRVLSGQAMRRLPSTLTAR